MSDLTVKKIVNIIAYVGICLIALALIFQIIFQSVGGFGSVIEAFRTIGECIAYGVTAFCAFFFVRRKRNAVWAIIYAICITVIVVLIILRYV